MKVVSKGATVAAWAHALWISGFAAPATAHAQTRAAPGATATTATTATPPAVGGDVIELKTGGVLRGTLIDAIPNGHARIQLVTGEVATVPWQEIAHIERAAGVPTSSPSASAPPLPAAARAETTAYVHIEGSDAAQLQRDTGDHRRWENVCSAPCDQAVPLEYSYRIGGAGIRNSRPFGLVDENGKRHTLYVDEASKTGFALGIVGVSVGALAATIGLLVVLVGEGEGALSSNGITRQDGSSAEEIGGAIAAIGLGALVGGIVLIATNAHTGVSQTPPATSTGLALRPPSIALGPSLRLPVLRAARTEALAAPMVSVPLFSGAF